MSLLFVAFAPVVIILIFIYQKDKYEKEPMGLLLKALGLGAAITLPIVIVELILGALFQSENRMLGAFYNGFVVAAFTEESFKFLAFYLLVWRNRNFNELFDGIVYAVFISLGFAAVENVMYVVGSGHGVGILRAFTAVPAHALFGITMGYYFALARFDPSQRNAYIWMALLVPILLHGYYDFCLFSEHGILLLSFLVFLVYLWISGFRKMKQHSDDSTFKDTSGEEEEDSAPPTPQ